MAEEAGSQSLPVVDVSAFRAGGAARQQVIADVRHAAEQVGFLYVRGLGIEAGRLEAAFATARRFFAEATGFKLRYAYDSADSNFGYQGLEAERLHAGSAPDLKETFTMRNALERAASAAWPDEVFRREALALYEAGLAAAHAMLEILGASLELPEGFFATRHRGENVTLRFLHYPAGLARRDASQFGAGAHTDYGSITLLFQDDVGGLEVRGADGQWRPAPPLPGCVLINTGDLMERWTNGRFRSTPHRVLPVTGARDRYSIALFVDPDAAVSVECIPGCVSAGRPARYPPITAGEHIRQKLLASHQVDGAAGGDA